MTRFAAMGLQEAQHAAWLRARAGAPTCCTSTCPPVTHCRTGSSRSSSVQAPQHRRWAPLRAAAAAKRVTKAVVVQPFDGVKTRGGGQGVGPSSRPRVPGLPSFLPPSVPPSPPPARPPPARPPPARPPPPLAHTPALGSARALLVLGGLCRAARRAAPPALWRVVGRGEGGHELGVLGEGALAKVGVAQRLVGCSRSMGVGRAWGGGGVGGVGWGGAEVRPVCRPSHQPVHLPTRPPTSTSPPVHPPTHPPTHPPARAPEIRLSGS